MTSLTTNDFKESQCGFIPIEWNVRNLADAVIFTKKPRVLDLSQLKTIPFVSMEYIPNNSVSNTGFIPKPPKEINSGTYCERGDILLAKITPSFENGKQAILNHIPEDFAYATTEVYAFKPLPTVAETMFLFYYFRLPSIRMELAAQMEGTTGRQRISKNVIEECLVVLPPLAEQRRIAAVLNTIQDAIAAQEDVIAAARAFKRSLMQRLFTYGPGRELAVTKETEIGEIPSHWEVIRLGDAITLQRGYDLPKQDRKEGSYPIISSSGVTGCHIEAKSKGPGVATGRYGTIGDVYYIESDFWPLNTTLFVKEFNGNNPRFMAYFLGMLDLASLNDKTSIPGINRNHVHEIQVGLPPIEEQTEIASILVVCDDKISAEEDRKAALQSFFQSTLQQLMTGQVRLLSDELPSI